MSITLRSILTSSSESSLLHTDIKNSDDFSQCMIYIDNIFEKFQFFEDQYNFLRDHFLSCMKWARLHLFFWKLQLCVKTVKILDITHEVRKVLKIIENHICKISHFSEFKNQHEIQAFIDMIDITRKWVKNYDEIAWSLNWLLKKIKWRWTKSEKLFFEILRIKCSTTISMHDIDWILDFHFYTNVSKFDADFYIIQFQNQDKSWSQNSDEFQN